MRRWIPAVAVVALLAAGLLFIRPAPKLASFTLSDGTRFEVTKITTGPSHRHLYGDRWQDYFGYIAPKTLRARLRPHLLEISSTNVNSLVIWTKSQGRPPMIQGLEIAVEDESGIQVPVEGTGLPGLMPRPVLSPTLLAARSRMNLARPSALGQANSNLWVAGWLVTPLPHHARDIGIAFSENGNQVGLLKLPNPAYRQTRKQTLDNPPVVKTVGDLQVKLDRVDISRNSQNTSRVDWAISTELLRDGTPTLDWQLEGVDVLCDGELFAQTSPAVRSSSGGLFSSFSIGGGSFSSGSSSGGIQTLSSSDPRSRRLPPGLSRLFPGAPASPLPGLWPDAVWTVRLWAAQRDQFTPDQVWILHNVPVTNAMEWKIERSEQRQIGTRSIELLGFRGPRVSWSGTNGTGMFSSGSAGDTHVCFATPPQSEGVRINFLRGWDDQGRAIERASNSYSSSTAPWSMPPAKPSEPAPVITGFVVRPAPEAKTLTLEFVVHQARSVDFLIKPILHE